MRNAEYAATGAPRIDGEAAREAESEAGAERIKVESKKWETRTEVGNRLLGSCTNGQLRSMRRLGLLLAVLAFSAVAVPSASGQGYQTDKGTVSFLHYNLIYGGEFTFPPEALQKKLSGSGFFLMRLRPDGAVDSVTTKMSTGYSLLDEHIIRLLKAYRFRPRTKQPIEWLVGFVYPGTVIVKLHLIKDDKSPTAPKNRVYFGQKVQP